MKVLIVIKDIDKKSGGPSRSVPNLALGLSQHGIKVSLMCVKTENMKTKCLEGSSVKLCALPKGVSNEELREAVLAERPDLIHIQSIWLPFYHRVAKIALRFHIPYIMTPRGCLEPWCIRRKWLKKTLAMMLFQKRDFQKAGCVLATSQMEADHIRTLGISVPVSVIPNGVNVDTYACRSDAEKSKIRKRIVVISRIDEKKGFDYLIKAWGRLYLKYPDWSVSIIGDGNVRYVKNLEILIRKNKLEKCVEILPPVYGHKKREMYISSSICVLPSHSENFGMSIAEAMACGLPVITTIHTPWLALNENDMGWCVDLTVDALVSAIDDALSIDSDELYEKGQKCSAYIQANYGLFQVAERNIMMYDWLFHNEQKPEFISLI